MRGLPLLLLLHCLAVLHGASGQQISVNVTSIRSGDSVRVSWKEIFATLSVDLESIPALKTVWLKDSAQHKAPVDRCTVYPHAGASSYWVGQFSPAITSPSQVVMGPKLAWTGTPPFTTPAPVKVPKLSCFVSQN